jgi:hypothetical protein
MGDGDVIASGWEQGAWIERRGPGETLRWRTAFAEDSDGFSFGVAVSPSDEIAAAGGRGATVVARLAPDGRLRWIRTLPLGSDSSSAGGVAIDASGAVLVAGRTSAPAFGLAGGGGDDAFVAKLDAAGDVAWARGIATSGVDVANAVAVDAAGAAVVVGTRGTDSGGSGVGFVARWDRDRKTAWTADLDWPGNEVMAHGALDAAGNAFVVGSFPADAFGFHTNGFLAKLTAPARWSEREHPPGGSAAGVLLASLHVPSVRP